MAVRVPFLAKMISCPAGQARTRFSNCTMWSGDAARKQLLDRSGDVAAAAAAAAAGPRPPSRLQEEEEDLGLRLVPRVVSYLLDLSELVRNLSETPIGAFVSK